MKHFIITIIALLSVACGGAVATEEQASPLESAPFCDGAGWTVYDVMPGQCMVAWSKGNNVPSWQESLASNCQAVKVCGLERAQNIHVDQTPYGNGCNQFAQTGQVAMATSDVVSIAIRIDSPELGSVEFFDIGSAECDIVAFDLSQPGSNGYSDAY